MSSAVPRMGTSLRSHGFLSSTSCLVAPEGNQISRWNRLSPGNPEPLPWVMVTVLEPTAAQLHFF